MSQCEFYFGTNLDFAIIIKIEKVLSAAYIGVKNCHFNLNVLTNVNGNGPPHLSICHQREVYKRKKS